MFDSTNGTPEGTSVDQVGVNSGIDATIHAQLSLATGSAKTREILAAAHGQSGHSPTADGKVAAGTTGESAADSGLLHLGEVAVKSTVKGFLEPAAGVLQLTEQVANTVTENTPGLGKAYFHPENLAPAQTTSVTKYSGEWFVQNIFENVGKIPWYILAAKTLTRMPGLGTDAGMLSERTMLGMNIKTAALSGLIMGGVSPTAVQKDGLAGLSSSLKERGIQAGIGLGQMTIMTLGTTGLGKAVSVGESMIAGRGGGLAAEEALSMATRAGASGSEASGLTLLGMTRNASIASIGSIPAGLAAGYANARAHGTKFDASENVIATMTVGFGLGFFGGGKAQEGNAGAKSRTEILSKMPLAPHDTAGGLAFSLNAAPAALHLEAPAAPAEIGQANSQPAAPVNVTRETLPGGRVIETHTHADGTVIEHHMPGSIPEYGNVKITKSPDGTVETRNSQWTYTEKKDGSSTYSDSYRTTVSRPDGSGYDQPTPAAEAYRDWFSLSQAQKLEALANLDSVPHGGDLIHKFVERAIFNGQDTTVREAALEQIKKITGTADQTETWNYTWGSFPEYRAQLFKMIPELDPAVQQNVMLGRGAALPDGSGTRSKISDLLEVFDAKHQGADGQTPASQQAAVDDYLQMIYPLPEAIRLKIFSAIDPMLRTGVVPAREQSIRPLIDRVSQGLENGDPVVTSAFGQFWNRDLINPTTRLNPTEVNRDGVPAIGAAAGATAAKLAQFQDIFKTPGNWETQAHSFIDQNPEIDLQKAIFDWADKQTDKSIQRVVDTTLTLDRLRDIYRNLVKDAPVKYSEQYETIAAPTKLFERARLEGLSTTQVRETMQNVLQLLEIANKYPGMKVAEDFRMAGMQALRQAADPLIITQGKHPTCALASLETSIYKKNPAEATRLVNEVLRTGKFVTTDGTTIKIDTASLKPEPNSLQANKTKWLPEREVAGYRSYASQVFQNTAANIYWQRQTVTPYLNFLNPPGPRKATAGSMRYEMREITSGGQTKLQDQLVHYGGQTRTVLKNAPYIQTLRELQDIGKQIGGDAAVPTVISPDNKVLASKQALEAYLQSLAPSQFPVIIGLDSKAMINPAKPDITLDHAVSLLTSPEGKVYIHNTWQPFSDVHEPGRWIPNTFSLDRLMELMGVP